MKLIIIESKKAFLLGYALIFFLNPIYSQEKYIEKAIESNNKNGDFYVAEVEGNKALDAEKVAKYCNNNGLMCQNYSYRYVQKFGGTSKSVSSFEFISISDYKKYEKIDKVNSALLAKEFISTFPNDKERIEVKFKEFCVRQLASNELIGYIEYIKYSNTGISEMDIKLIEAIKRDPYIMPTKIPEFVTSISKVKNVNFTINAQDLNTIDGIEKFYFECKRHSFFSQDVLNELTFRVLDRMEIINTSIVPEYARKELLELTNLNPTEADFENFKRRFPKSNLMKEVDAEYAKLDKQKWESAVFLGSEDSYRKYLNEFKNGAYRSQALNKIKEIESKIKKMEQERAEREREQIAKKEREEKELEKRIENIRMGDVVKSLTYDNNSGWKGIVVGKQDGRYQVEILEIITNSWFKTGLSATKCSGNKRLDSYSKGEKIWISPSCITDCCN